MSDDQPKATGTNKGQALAIVLCTLVVLVFSILQLDKIELKNDVENWLPESDPQAKILSWTREHFPRGDRIYITWDGSSLKDERIGAVAEAVEKVPGVTDVAIPQELFDRIKRAGIEDEEVYDRMTGLMIGPGEGAIEDRAIVLSAGIIPEDEEPETKDIIEGIREATISAGIPEEAMHLAGRRTVETELDKFVVEGIRNTKYPIWQMHKRSPTLLSILVSIFLGIILLRQFRLALLVLISMATAAIIATAMIPITGGSMNMVLVVMPPLLMTLTLSAAIHVANYWKHSATHGDKATAPFRARKDATVPCFLASATTAIGLASLMTSPLSPVRDFGFYSAIGCFASLFCALYLLPALITLIPVGNPRGTSTDSMLFSKLGRGIAHHAVPISLICLASFGLAVAGLQYFRTETKVIRYFPKDSRIVNDYHHIEDNLTGVIPVEVVVRFTPEVQEEIPFVNRIELVRNVEQSIRQHPDITGTLAMPDFLRKPEDWSLAYNARMRRLESAIHDGGDEDYEALITIADDSLVNQGKTLASAGDELWHITAQVYVMTDLNYVDLTEDLNKKVETVLADTGGSYFVTGTVPLFLRTQQAVLESLIKSFGLAFGIIGVLMMILLRSVGGGFLTMLPNLLPVGLVFGLVSWFGLVTDIGTMITASVALGIAVDGTLHLITWFRRSLDETHDDRAEAIAAAMGHCGPAMWQTSAVVSIGLLMLGFAKLLLISRFGWLMAALVFAALIADLIYLPSLICGPLGRWIVPSVKNGKEGEGEPGEDSNESPSESVEAHSSVA
ncbi:efflux RND transporter permease subunit [Calycomorphotria hydatis]|uniref:MMPL family protein n=1 Tax=Calycomorphotria hydatis TaxID=2528027 RepID=A0A517T4F4_9PLAN|nr:MMPL family transporter [Calycomorphotria hydatis]QDT63241.1 MMPL family protein [Calycomorphotria hydatis]